MLKLAERTDWRGRVYPKGTVVPPHLRPAVDDPCDDWSNNDLRNLKHKEKTHAD